MQNRFLGFTIVLFSTLAITPVWGQSALDKLEQKLQGALNPPAQAPGTLPPAIATDDTLPPPPEAPPGAAEATVEPGYLGLVVEEAREGEAGPRVSTVRPGSPAALAGAKVGDAVISIDGRAIRTLDDMDAVLANAVAGQTLRLVLSRAGQQLAVSPALVARGAASRTVPPAAAVELSPPAAVSGRASLGVSVANITAESRQRFNLPVPRGALITSLTAGSAAEQAGLPLGGAIVALDGRVVENAEQLVTMVREAKPGQEVELTYYQADRLFRKSVRLATVPDVVAVPFNDGSQPVPGEIVQTPAPPTAPIPGQGIFQGGGDRPLLRTLEKVIQGVGNVEINGQPLPSMVLRPAAPQEVPGAVPANPGLSPVNQELAELRSQVRLLQEQMDRMERLLRQFEERAPQRP